MSEQLDLTELLTIHEVDAILVTSLHDIRWCCGFTGSNALLLITRDGWHFVTDGRYTEQSRREVTGAELHIASGNLLQHIEDAPFTQSLRRVAIQADEITLLRFEELRETLPGVEWIAIPGPFEGYRARKTEREIQCIIEAQHITESVFEYMLGFIKPGMSETEIAAEVVYQHLRRGATGMSFDPIIASGENSALPHARPGGRSVQPGDMIVIDMGCFVHGYASDMTRTIALGDPGEEARSVYAIVLDAQLKALEGASAQLSSRELDSLARSVIENAGYGSYFSHSLGHGVGLEIHESPSITWRVDVPLSKDMVVTIEPGIYLPERFGVRIEDIIRLKNDGSENLTAATKDLIML